MAKLSGPKRKVRGGGGVVPTVSVDSDSEVSDDLRLDEGSDDDSASNSDAEEVSDVEVSDDDDDEEEEEEDESFSDADAAIEEAMRSLIAANGDGEDSDAEDAEAIAPGEASDGGSASNSDEEEQSDNYGDEEDAPGDINGVEEKIDGEKTVEESDSEDDGELASRNTIGEVPLEWYKDEKHIGYDIDGKKITKKERKDQLDAFLARADSSKDWRKLYDEYNDEEIELTKEEIEMIQRLRTGRIPHADVNPYEPYVDWFEWEDKGHPLSNAPEPKRRFIPSKWEAKKVVKLVRALRKGWISLEKPKEKPKYYLLWGDDLQTANKTANGLAYIPAPKPKLPGHEESYNPPEEYIPTQEEINAYQLMYEEDRPKYIPKAYDALRKVPAYADYIKERFERCLDLYLCPRARKRRINIDPESLIPKLPKAKDLQPFPTTCFLEYRGHTKAVCTLATSPCGEWLASGSLDGTVRLWEVQTGRCRKIWEFGDRVRQIAWNPNPQLSILAVAVESNVVLVNTEMGTEEEKTSVAAMLSLLPVVRKPTSGDIETTPLCSWVQDEKFKGLKLRHQQVVHCVSWHYKGDYFVSVAPESNTRAVLVHQLSKQQSQNPFRKHHGRVIRVIFHPTRPFLFVATKVHVRIYNLLKQQLSKKLMTGLNEISSMAIHPGGDNLILGSKDAKMCWFDMDLSTKPYKTLKNHKEDIREVAYHKTYPLFATCSDDSTAHIFHGMVYSDLLQNPLIVPVKVLRGHQKGIFDCEFHPKQPWLFTAGGDEVIKLYCN